MPGSDTLQWHPRGMDLGLKGKVAMVGGASRGLGFAVAEVLAREGALVSIASRDESAIKTAADRIGHDRNAQVLATAIDVKSAEGIQRWARETEQTFGGIDLLFANAGGPPAGAALSFDDAAWQSAVDLLLFSAIRMVRAAVPSMSARGGGAILVSTSSSVKEPIPNLGLSTVLRASVSALAKTLALELAPSGIRVNQIVPGRIDTDRLKQLDEINAQKQGITPDQQKARSIGGIPMARYGQPEEFGRVAAFLLSNAASYMTGATVQVDGGLIRSVL
jgi:3-oxoacyl-[acyl-carrier protein] reductase